MKPKRSIFLSRKLHFVSIALSFLLFIIFIYDGYKIWSSLIGSVLISYLTVFSIGFIIRKNKEGREIEMTSFNVLLKRVIKKCEAIAKRNRIALATQRSQLVFKDPYGMENTEDWVKKGIAYFLEHQVIPNLEQEEVDCIIWNRCTFENIIDKIAKDGQSVLDSINDYDPRMSGVDYEIHCKKLLEKNNWQVRTTKDTGDQGVDLIAEKDGFKIAIQCKKYSRSIGNKAVQEIYSGMRFYDLPIGLVVSNQTFTQAAKVLANKNHIHLIHHDLLSTDELIEVISC